MNNQYIHIQERDKLEQEKRRLDAERKEYENTARQYRGGSRDLLKELSTIYNLPSGWQVSERGFIPRKIIVDRSEPYKKGKGGVEYAKKLICGEEIFPPNNLEYYDLDVFYYIKYRFGYATSEDELYIAKNVLKEEVLKQGYAVSELLLNQGDDVSNQKCSWHIYKDKESYENWNQRVALHDEKFQKIDHVYSYKHGVFESQAQLDRYKLQKKVFECSCLIVVILMLSMFL
ncbi:hypothetical protein ACSLBF_08165 [Pseudoalteromonas sp. T1lg65]|uniref:hypothetical protein n=1 Tax=Pseudoalteromonas sp. T1lg65 TaxID=2077101 RepID=UPI003F7939A3